LQEPPQDPHRILIVRLSHLGDVIHALPVLHALHARWPRAEIGWAVQPEFADLVEGLPGVARTFHFDRGGGWRAWPRLRRELRAFAPDLTVDAQGNLKSGLVTRLSGAPRRVGLARAYWREPLGALALTEQAPAATPELGRARLHAIEVVRTLARHLAPAQAEPERLDAALDAEELATGERLLDRQLPGARSGDVVVHLSSPEDVRSWPTKSFVELARALAADGRRVLLLCGPRELEAGRDAEASLASADGVRTWIGQQGLRQLAGLLAAAAARGMRFVGCDSGPMHLAAACGLPVVLLAGPQDADRTGPWPRMGPGSPHRVVRADQGPRCAPCLARRCDHADGPVCMTGIAPGAVLSLLGGSATSASVS
jgi:ADP-heptose:LPS heptosyltransferase